MAYVLGRVEVVVEVFFSVDYLLQLRRELPTRYRLVHRRGSWSVFLAKTPDHCDRDRVIVGRKERFRKMWQSRKDRGAPRWGGELAEMQSKGGKCKNAESLRFNQNKRSKGQKS